VLRGILNAEAQSAFIAFQIRVIRGQLISPRRRGELAELVVIDHPRSQVEVGEIRRVTGSAESYWSRS